MVQNYDVSKIYGYRLACINVFALGRFKVSLLLSGCCLSVGKQKSFSATNNRMSGVVETSDSDEETALGKSEPQKEKSRRSSGIRSNDGSLQDDTGVVETSDSDEKNTEPEPKKGKPRCSSGTKLNGDASEAFVFETSASNVFDDGKPGRRKTEPGGKSNGGRIVETSESDGSDDEAASGKQKKSAKQKKASFRRSSGTSGKKPNQPPSTPKSTKK